MPTIDEIITTSGITMTATQWHENPHIDDNQKMDHWRCILRHGRRRMTVYFSKGIGHKGTEPTIAEVLDCLASDASTVDNAQGFEDWASDLGYDPDSRKAERTFKAVQRQSDRLRDFLGDSLYRTLLWETERL